MPLAIESVWDYPRPPKIERVDHRLLVTIGAITIADTTSGFRILETSHPPTYYIPRSDVAIALLVESDHHSYCEFKGQSTYYSISAGGKFVTNAAWSYETPTSRYRPIAGMLSFYASADVHCQVDDEVVSAQPGSFYGGWITTNLKGPFKGGPGSRFW